MGDIFDLPAQLKKENFKLGIAYGQGSQSKFPYFLKDHRHTVVFYKTIVNYRLKQKGRWAYEFQLEPSINIAKHQLLNESLISTEIKDYQKLRELHTTKRRITEYVLNCGILVRYRLYKNLSANVIGGVGPMISNKETERLAKGFAFSDVFGLGLSYSISRIVLDFRYSIRHTSNLDFKQPNRGHNTTNIEFGLLFRL
ncbi:acyloxyacyl hydrolase [Seonamhaeicola sp. MEBiC1930]|uniref:acyloxyacyl hydrolase n=1 Tax=Seonamhaeicola sp. MEBiC01930 TaxID=2976768 RepID=UPI003253C05E